MSKKEKQLSTTPWINEEILAKIDYAPRQTQDPKVLILTQNFFQAKLDSALSSAVFAVLTASARAKGALGCPFLGSPGNFWGPGSNSQIEI